MMRGILEITETIASRQLLSRFILATVAATMTTVRAAEPEPAQTQQVLRWNELDPGDVPPAELSRWQKMLHPNGNWHTLTVEPRAAKSQVNTLTVPAGRILWVGIRPEAVPAKDLPPSWQIIGDLQAAPISVEELSPLKQLPSLLPVPPGLNLARHQEWTPFGIEERATVHDAPDAFSWTVKPGEKPAGFYTAASWRLPKGALASTWKLELTLRGKGQVMLGVATESAQGFGDPDPIATTELTGAPQVVSWEVPSKVAAAKSLRLSLVATEPQGGSGVIETLSWQLLAVTLPQPAPMGVWDWSTRPEVWTEKQPAWKAAGIKVLQLALPRELGSDSGGVATTLSRLRADGFRIVAVEGDPHMILPQARAAVIARHQALSQWQGRFLDGVQYDVEPYLLPGFHLETTKWHQHWLDLYRELNQNGKHPVEPVLPFWIIAQKEAVPLLDGLAKYASRMVIMNYRSDPVEAAAWATAWLEWSRQHNCPVALAVECGPISDLKSAAFYRADKGTLWMAPWPGYGTAAVLYEAPVAAASGGRVYSIGREGRVPGDRTTLRDRPLHELSAWLGTLNAVQQRLSLPDRLQPLLLLHEPTPEVLRHLATEGR
ncbi:hypothetical protein [Verrucomicrobium sp. BvORR106]|uniref:hypothetical protein n=1 Tax=Verrucomicrobium sp. BvORR106 TaxID=1403819 RepID=UPI0005713A7B|nr:hypothetical protein [Verrucomicrobium sp. BvORR106]